MQTIDDRKVRKKRNIMTADVPEVRSRYLDKLVNMLTIATRDNDFYKCNALICRYMELHTLAEFTYLRQEFHKLHWEFENVMTAIQETEKQVRYWELSRDLWGMLKSALPPEDYARIDNACEYCSHDVSPMLNLCQDKLHKEQIAETMSPEQILIDNDVRPENVSQVFEAEKFASFTLNDKKISRKKAIELLGKHNYWCGMNRAAFHRSTGRTSPAGEVYIDCSRYFK